MTHPTTARTAAASAGQEPEEPDLVGLLRTISQIQRTDHPSPEACGRAADVLHTCGTQLLHYARRQAQHASTRDLHDALPTLQQTLDSRPRPAGTEHVTTLAGQLRTVANLLQQDSGEGLAEQITRATTPGQRGYAPGDYVTKEELGARFGAPRYLIQRAVTLLVERGVLEWAGQRRVRVPVPGQQPHRTLSEHAADHLRKRIISGAYPGGQPLPSRQQLAREFRCSITPVQNALDELRAEGLVTWAPGTRTVAIAPPSPGGPNQSAAEPELVRPALGTYEQEALLRLLRQHLCGCNRYIPNCTHLRTAWSAAVIGTRARLLGRLAWHARDAALSPPASPGERLASDLRTHARRYSDPDHVLPTSAQLSPHPIQQLEAALVLLAACPDPDAALCVDLAPEAAP
ncbi:winged helix-turn-helix domain-containing protein [Streptomyces qinglanensis]|uniref:winged helix-turn-helix domain-containing protein n=1 Tax=Streptomyces qinglanensis TaxID=943816 RepID=UPI003D71BBF6